MDIRWTITYIYLGFFPSKDMQIVDFVHNFQVFFTLVTIQLFTNFFFLKWSNLHERCAMNRNAWKINFPIFAIFSFWVLIDFLLKNRLTLSIKTTTSQRLKFVQKITHKVKNQSQNNTHLSCKFEHFWTTFFWSINFC